MAQEALPQEEISLPAQFMTTVAIRLFARIRDIDSLGTTALLPYPAYQYHPPAITTSPMMKYRSLLFIFVRFM